MPFSPNTERNCQCILQHLFADLPSIRGTWRRWQPERPSFSGTAAAGTSRARSSGWGWPGSACAPGDAPPDQTTATAKGEHPSACNSFHTPWHNPAPAGTQQRQYGNMTLGLAVLATRSWQPTLSDWFVCLCVRAYVCVCSRWGREQGIYQSSCSAKINNCVSDWLQWLSDRFPWTIFTTLLMSHQKRWGYTEESLVPKLTQSCSRLSSGSTSISVAHKVQSLWFCALSVRNVCLHYSNLSMSLCTDGYSGRMRSAEAEALTSLGFLMKILVLPKAYSSSGTCCCLRISATPSLASPFQLGHVAAASIL